MEPVPGLRLLASAALALSGVAHAKVFLGVDEALAKAFPPARKCKVRVENRYLTQEQRERAKALAGSEIPSALVVRYAAICEGKAAGYAYTDTHRVRTHPETLLIVVDPPGRIERVEVISFDEPLEYNPRTEWYGTFQGAALDESLQVKRKIPFVTGASLTSAATTQAARRTLAIDQVLRP